MPRESINRQTVVHHHPAVPGTLPGLVNGRAANGCGAQMLGICFAKANVTRGHGLLERLLSELRCRKADSLIPSAHRQGRLLDIGCGVYPLFLLETMFSEKYGLDKTSVCRAETVESQAHIKLIECDIERATRIPLPSDWFDIITMLAVFEHIEPSRLPRILSEIYRILKPGGKFIMTTPARWTDSLLRSMARVGLVSHVEIEEHKAAYVPPMILALLRQASFSRDMLRHGYFEVWMNIWVSATK